jgi:hypothetical protein
MRPVVALHHAVLREVAQRSLGSARELQLTKIPVVHYLARETLFLETALAVLDRGTPAEDRLKTLSLLALPEVVRCYPKRLEKTIKYRALVECDAAWYSWVRDLADAGQGEADSVLARPACGWGEVRATPVPLLELGPFTAYPAQRGVPRPWVSIRLVPGALPPPREADPSGPRDVRRETLAPAWLNLGQSWPAALEIVVTRKEEHHEGSYPTIYLWLIPDSWLEEIGAVPTNAGMSALFLEPAAECEVIPLGQQHDLLELSLKIALDRARVLSARERLTAESELGSFMVGRDVGGQVKGTAPESEIIARQVASEVFRRLVRRFKRPLHSRSLEAYCRRALRIRAAQSTAVSTGRKERAASSYGFNGGPESPENQAIIGQVLDKVRAALDRVEPRTLGEVSQRVQYAFFQDRHLQGVSAALDMLMEEGKVSRDSGGRYLLSDGINRGYAP